MVPNKLTIAIAKADFSLSSFTISFVAAIAALPQTALPIPKIKANLVSKFCFFARKFVKTMVDINEIIINKIVPKPNF
jgi:hypothetical protein